MNRVGIRSKERAARRVLTARYSLLATGYKLQRGFSLISAIFLLVVIAALGTFAVTLSTTQNQSQALEVLGARGFQAALAGVEWAAFNVNQQPVNSATPWAGCASAQALTVGGSLAAFSPVSVSCSATSAVEGTNTRWIYSVSSVAHTAGTSSSANYVEQIATSTLVK